MSSSEGKGSEDENLMGSGNGANFYDHKAVYRNRHRYLLPEVVSTDDDSPGAGESTDVSESAESGARGSSDGMRRRKRKKVTIKYATKSAAEGGDGKRTLAAGTLKRIIEWLIEKEVRPIKAPLEDVPATAPPPLAATALVLAFFAGYRQYCTPVDLFHTVEAYFYRPAVKGKLKRREKRRRAVHFILYWVKANFTQDFFTKDSKKKKGSYGIPPPKTEPPLLFKKLTDLLNIMSKKFPDEVNKIKLLLLRGAASKPQRSFSLKHRKKMVKGNGRVEILSIDTRVLAEQMTLLESEMFLAIKPTEFFNQAWKSSAKKKTAPHIVTMVDRFNTVSYWVASSIVMCKDMKKRSLLLKKFINLAEVCLEIRNFSSLMAILGGLNNASVLRLKETWATLKGLEKTTLEALNTMMENKLNYKRYREALTQEEGQHLPLVPYLGVYLRDLTFIEDGNPDYVDNLINFQKLIMLGEVVLEVREWQAHGSYDLKRNSELEAFLMKLVVLPEDVLYKMSEGLEAADSSNGGM